MTPQEEIEQQFIREFSHSGNLIGKSTSKAERRERVRQAIYVHRRANDPFHGEGITYAEAFRACYGERLDRRAATRDPGPPTAYRGQTNDESPEAAMLPPEEENDDETR